MPLLAEALVRGGRTGLTVEARNKFVKACEGVDTVLGCLQNIRQAYPESVREEYTRRWEQAEKARPERAKKRARQTKAWLDGEETMDDGEEGKSM